MHSAAAAREKIPELQLVRAIAIIGVLCVHSTSFATLYMTESSLYDVYNFVNIFMKYGTPTFIFLSSFVLFYNYYARPLDKPTLKRFYERRMLYILLPYLFFSIFYFMLVHFLYYSTRPLGESLADFALQLLTGKAYTHLYFVFISIQFYLLFPVCLWLFKRYPALLRWSIPLGLAIQWAFVIVNKYEWQVPNKGSWSLSYMSYFLMGAFLGVCYQKAKPWLTMSMDHAGGRRVFGWIALWSVWLAAGLAHVYIWRQARLFGTDYNTTLYELLWNVHTFAAAIVVFQLAFLVKKMASTGIVRWLSRLGELSFGIYLIHPFFLLLYRAYPPHSGAPWLNHLWYAGGFLFALVCSWIAVAAAARLLPFSWLLFGSLMKPEQRQKRTVDG